MRLGTAVTLVAVAALVAACAGMQSGPRADAVALMKRDFHAVGIAGMDRLNEDAVQAACNKYNDNPPADVAKKLQAQQYAAIKWPADGKLMGDWKTGEKIAQRGRGMTWRDKPDAENGGSCYNCHQLAPEEQSYGTLGPSLKGFGKVRGNSMEIQRYAYGKIYNSKAYSACSQMPRLGYSGTLTEKQIKDVVAYLLDPASPVNK